MKTRKMVYLNIDEERDYQDSLGDDRVEDSERPHTVGEEILMLERYVAKARDAYTDNAGTRAALHEVRKIAALAVRCMENHGAPRREERSRIS